MGKITVTFDTELHKVVPLSETTEWRENLTKIGYSHKSVINDIVACAPVALTNVAVHSGENIGWWSERSLEFANVISGNLIDDSWHKVFTHPPAQPDTEALKNDLITRLNNTQGMELISAAIDAADCLTYNATEIRSLKARIAELEASATAIVQAALEAAAKVCDSVNNNDNPMTATDCAEAIRAIDPQTIIDAARNKCLKMM